MKAIILIIAFFSIQLLSISSNGQSFNLTDSVFKPGDVLISNSILFDLAKPTLRQESYIYLDSIVDFLNRNDDLVIEVGNHSDNRGSDKFSNCLTCNRAKSVVDYLISKGISKDRLTSMGYAGTKPIISASEIAKLSTVEEEEMARQTNRRTEFKIIKITAKDNAVFDYITIENKPEFPGGEAALLKYIAENIKYPSDQNECFFDKIFLSFTIDTFGECKDLEIFKNNYCVFSNEAEENFKEIFENMPLWEPGEYSGKKVNVRMKFPIHFTPGY